MKPKERKRKKIFSLVVDSNPRAPDISKIIKKYVNVLYSSPELKELFPSKSIIPAFRRAKNLKEIIAPFKLKRLQPDSGLECLGCFKCNKKCDLCQNFLRETESFVSSATGRSYKIKQHVGCTSTNVIYLVSCLKCKLQYVGYNHKSAMITNKKSCETAIHYNQSPHSLEDVEFVYIEKMRKEGELN